MYLSNNQLKYLKDIKKRKRLILFTQIALTLLFLGLWEYLTYKEVLNSFIYSSPSNIIKTIYNLYLQNNLFIHIFTTLYEVIIAFILGIIIAFIISIIFYENEFLAKVFDPFLTVLNSLPKVALGPILIIITGANTKSIILMAILINAIVSIITFYNSFQNTDKVRLKMFQTFNASKKDILFKLVIPENYKSIISSLKLNVSLTLIGVITGEFLVSKKGIGYLIIYGTQIFNLDLVMSGIFILLILSFILYKIVTYIEKRLIS